MRYTIYILFLTINFLWSEAQTWISLSKKKVKGEQEQIIFTPQKYELFRADTSKLLQQLKSVSANSNDLKISQSNIIIDLPYPDGTSKKFRIVNSPIMEEGLQQKYPQIVTLKGYGIDDPYAVVRMDWSPYFGFHAMVLSPHGNVFIDPYISFDKEQYISYYQKDYLTNKIFICGVKNEKIEIPLITTSLIAAHCRGSELFSYRLAVSCTGEYAKVATNRVNPTKAEVMAAIITTINRIVGIYERELSINLTLVANNDQIIYVDPTTDPYTSSENSLPNMLKSKGQIHITSKIGSANFDIGHTFGSSSGGGGEASLASVCQDTRKASGASILSSLAVGNPFDIGVVAHEIGHQFGANHTFNSVSGQCSGNREGSTAYEPGGGTTIMGYSGACSSDALQPSSDPYFHASSYNEIINYILESSGSTCKNLTYTGNNSPIVLTMPANGSVIPKQTPFILDAIAYDPDGDVMNYCWEEMDLGIEGGWNVSTGTAPLFRSRLPQMTSSRTFPDMRLILTNYPIDPIPEMNGLKGETLPTTSRTMNFRLTVRDNKGGIGSGGAQSCSPVRTSCAVTVDGAAGPFLVNIPNGGEIWNSGTTKTITWNVANTGIGTMVGCTHVNILLSIDGGITYPITLKNATPNDGTETITVPVLAKDNGDCRIKIEAWNNIFFDISNGNFTIKARGWEYLTSEETKQQSVKETLLSTDLFPNPFDNQLWIKRKSNAGNTNITITLFNTEGKQLLQHTWALGSNEPIKVSHLPVGLYTAKIEENGTVTYKKLVKK